MPLRHILDVTLPDFGRLAVLPDPDNHHPHYYAIVCHMPLHPAHQVAGYRRGYGERYYGLYAYRFAHWLTAAWVAHQIASSHVPTFLEDE